MHFVKKINSIEGYKITLTFKDNKIKVVDIEPYLDKGVFLILRDPTYFNQVKVSGDTLVWPNEADFCPDVLYEIGKDVATQLITRRRRSISAGIKNQTLRTPRKHPKKAKTT